MGYANQGVATSKQNLKVIGVGTAALVLSLAMSLFAASSVGAHEVVNVVNEDKANCYGKIASMHAKEDKGLKKSYANWNHVGIGLNGSETFQEEAAAIKAACREE